MKVNQQAPVCQTGEILIQASPARVWSVLTDINHWPRWHTAISRANTEASPAPGVTFDWTVNGARIHSVLHTVTPYEAFGWSGTTFGGAAIHNWYLIPQADATLVKVEESLEGWLVRLFKTSMNQSLSRDIQSWLTSLKHTSEA
ncbi:MAG: SRPBCC family protein [Bacteroidia bacterium]|nr:SRPBCC family protein [Bacteroidia bacterium]